MHLYTRNPEKLIQSDKYTYPSVPYSNSRESFRFFRSISYLGLRKANIYTYTYIFSNSFVHTNRNVQLTLRLVSGRVLPASYRSSCRSIVAIDKIYLLIYVLQVFNFTSSVSPRSVIL